jgi:hypothetical protein
MAEAAGPVEDVAHDDLCPVCDGVKQGRRGN